MGVCALSWVLVVRCDRLPRIVASVLMFILVQSLAAQTFSVLHAFQDKEDGISPFGGVGMDKDGNLYGTATQGGDPHCGCGVVFKITP